MKKSKKSRTTELWTRNFLRVLRTALEMNPRPEVALTVRTLERAALKDRETEIRVRRELAQEVPNLTPAEAATLLGVLMQMRNLVTSTPTNEASGEPEESR